MPGGGGRDDILRSPAPARGRQQRQPKWLPLDVVAEIAARTDAATLVRCAATCKSARRRIADDPSFLGRLRLRHTDRFLLPLLRGHFGGQDSQEDLYLVDTSTADTTLTRVNWRFSYGPNGKRLEPLDSRDGLLLVRAAGDLRVCDPATCRSQACSLEPSFIGSYVLLVGDNGKQGGGAVGRPLQVLKAQLVVSESERLSWGFLHIQTFSSEHGTWGSRTTIPAHGIVGGTFGDASPMLDRHGRPLVIGDVVYWLCLTESGSYVLMLHVGAARATVTTLPASFPRARAPAQPRYGNWRSRLFGKYLLATTSVGGSPIVLVADEGRISAWPQSKHTKIWKQRPQVVIDKEAILQFGNARELLRGRMEDIELKWFAERSGVVLIQSGYRGFLWLDLQSKAIVRCFSDPRINTKKVYCPYDMRSSSSWVPTFSSTLL
ncbi:unnamed protein product [Urochloa humidicola]